MAYTLQSVQSFFLDHSRQPFPNKIETTLYSLFTQDRSNFNKLMLDVLDVATHCDTDTDLESDEYFLQHLTTESLTFISNGAQM